MPRPRKECIRLTGRVIAGGGSSKEDLEFVESKLKVMDQSTLVRHAINVYRKYENGDLFKDILEKSLDDLIMKIIKNLKGLDFNEINIEDKEEAAGNEIEHEELDIIGQEHLAKLKKNIIDGFF